MKQKISVSINKEKIKQVEELLKHSKYRSKSHVVEYALKKLLEEEQ